MPSLLPLRAERALTVHSPAIPSIAGAPILEPLQLAGEEGINQLFHYTLTLQTPDLLGLNHRTSPLNLDDFLGQAITCRIELEGHGSFQAGLAGAAGLPGQGAGVREINAIITAARFLREDPQHTLYELELRPWLHIATLSSNCRVFQNQTPIEIIESLLASYPFPAEKRILETYTPRDYCTQYNETNFAFLTRLMQTHGISYWFEHHGGAHRLVWSDHNAAYAPFRPQAADASAASQPSPYQHIPYYPPGHKIDREYIHHFSPTNRLTSARFASREYDYTRPRAPLDAQAHSPRPTAHADQEIFLWRAAQAPLGGINYSQPNAGSHPDAHHTEEVGHQLALLRMQNLRQHGLRAHGEGHVRTLVPGCTFTLTEHPQPAANTDYVVLHTRLVVENADAVTQRTGLGAGLANVVAALSDSQRLSGQWRVVVAFEAQPARQAVRPALTQTKPLVHGVQNALVCGPEAEQAETNLYTDTLGRIKVQFYWDRYGSKNHQSSCWVRVASPWAGNQLGAVALPRVGQEVVVGFYEGDPDLPIVLGSVHNALNLSPWALPAQQALTGWRSRELLSDRGNSAAGRSNHVLLDDTPGQIQAQLRSDHLHSQLAVGHITQITDHTGRQAFQGEGFDLRTQGHGAVRAQQGLLLSAFAPAPGAQSMLEMGQTTDALRAAVAQHRELGALAAHHGAHAQAGVDALAQALGEQVDDLAGLGHTRSAQSHPEMRAAHVTLAGPAGVQSSTPGSTHQYSGAHHAVSAGQQISWATPGSLLSAVGKHFRAFANGGMRLIAAKGKMELAAQDNDMQLLAHKVLELIGKQGIALKSEQSIRLCAGQHAIEVSAARGIAFVSPIAPQFHTAGLNVAAAMSNSQHLQDSPHSAFNDKLDLLDEAGRPYANQLFEITRGDGSVVRATTNSRGELPLQRSDSPENLVLRLVRPRKT